MKTKDSNISENSLYHDTWTLLRKYRDVVWSLELSVQKARRHFQVEYGSSIEDFLESVYIAIQIPNVQSVISAVLYLELVAHQDLVVVKSAISLLEVDYCHFGTCKKTLSKIF